MPHLVQKSNYFPFSRHKVLVHCTCVQCTLYSISFLKPLSTVQYMHTKKLIHIHLPHADRLFGGKICPLFTVLYSRSLNYFHSVPCVFSINLCNPHIICIRHSYIPILPPVIILILENDVAAAL